MFKIENNKMSITRGDKSKTSLSVYVNTSSYGLFPDQDYEFFIVYSS